MLMAGDKIGKRHFNNVIKMKHTYTNVKCDKNVRMKIKKSNFLYAGLHGVDLTMCKYQKHPSILKYQSKNASKQDT